MKDITDKNFGVVIAFWLPGVILLWGLSYSYPGVSRWLNQASGSESPSVGGFLYLTLASLAVGLIVSAVRWMIVDKFLQCVTGLREPQFDFGKLKDKEAFAVFLGVVENHYRFYQYYSNTLVAVMSAFITYLIIQGPKTISGLVWVAFIVACPALLWASYDCLKKYYSKSEQIASSAIMGNGQ